MSLQILKMIDSSVLGEIVPNDFPIRIEHFLLGTEPGYYSYTQSITTTAMGNISGGGTATGTYKKFYFGCNVYNAGERPAFIKLRIAKIDTNGYILDEYFIREDVNPKEKKRTWAGFLQLKKLNFIFIE